MLQSTYILVQAELREFPKTGPMALTAIVIPVKYWTTKMNQKFLILVQMTK